MYPNSDKIAALLLAAAGLTIGCPNTGGFNPGSDTNGATDAADDSDADDISDDTTDGDGDCTTKTWYADCDGDDYAARSAPARDTCSKPPSAPQNCSGTSNPGWTDRKPEPSAGTVDCDDTDAATNPGASEKCDGQDNDCDGIVDGLRHQCPVVSLFGTSSSEVVSDAVALGGGEVLVVGWTSGDLAGETNAGDDDGFIATVSRGGSLKNVTLVGTSASDKIDAVATGEDGARYVAGQTRGAFGSATNQGGRDVFVAKYRDGQRKWVDMMGSSNLDRVGALELGPFGGLYVVGTTTGDMASVSHEGSFDGYLAKYDTSGNRKFAVGIGTPTHDDFFDIAVDENARLYLAGMSDGSLNGESGAGGLDAVLVKMKSDATHQWTRFLGSSSGDRASSVEIGSEGRIHLVGVVGDSVEGKPHLSDTGGFWALYSPDGSRQGLQMLQSNQEDSIRDLDVGPNGAIYIGAWTYGSLFGISTVAKRDSVAARFDLEGNSLTRVWASRLSSPENDEITSVGLTDEGRPFVFGFSDGNLEGETNQGEGDGFVAW